METVHAEVVNDERVDFMNSIKVGMINLLDKEQFDILNSLLLNLLSQYELQKKSTELTTYDYTNEGALTFFEGLLRMKGKSEKTIKQYIRATKNCLDSIGKRYDLIDEIDMLRYFAVLGTKVSKVTYNNYIRWTSPFFINMQKVHKINFNPMCNIESVRVDYKEKKPFTPSEMNCLKDNATNIRDVALMEFLYSTGCRISETLQLNKSDIIDDECVVYGKGNKERVVFLNDSAKYYLKLYLDSRTDNEEALFVSLRNGVGVDHPIRMKVGNAQKTIKGLGERCGIKKAHPHRFRRTNCTTLLSRGVPIQEVQYMMGHSNIATTTIYNSMNKENLKHKHSVSL